MNTRDTKFIFRIIVLVVFALVFSVAARVFLESAELEKVVPRSVTRDLLAIAAPIASLLAFHYTLAVKSFGTRSLLTEAFVSVFYTGLYLGIVLAYVFGETIVLPPQDCSSWWPWSWFRECEGNTERKENVLLGALIGAAGVCAGIAAVYRELFLRRR